MSKSGIVFAESSKKKHKRIWFEIMDSDLHGIYWEYMGGNVRRIFSDG